MEKKQQRNRKWSDKEVEKDKENKTKTKIETEKINRVKK